MRLVAAVALGGALGSVARWLLVLAAWLGWIGCARAPEPAEDERLETVEVGVKLDEYATLDEEPVEVRRREPASGIAGVLPEGFPSDVPLPVPSSLVDFVAEPGRGLSVTLEHQSPPEAALRSYEAKLRAAGFRDLGEGGWERGGRRIRVSVESFGGAARITVEIVRGRR